MIAGAALAKSLRRIEADLAALRASATAEHPVDPHELHILAVKVGCQAELLEKNLVE